MSNILKGEDILHSSTSEPSKPSRKKKKSKKNHPTNSSDTESDDGTFVQMRGRIVSGRFWKSQKQPAKTAIKTPGIRLSLVQKQKLREDLKRVKEMSRAMERERIEAKLLKKQRREENLRRAEENRKKNEVVQAIKNPLKIKKMKRSQLRRIEKRDVTVVAK